MEDTQWKPMVRLRVGTDGKSPEDAFGPGTARLLQGIQKYESLYRSAAEMGMAYSKAWKSLRATEENLGFALITRLGPRGSRLTEEGEAFLERYLKAEEAAKAAVAAVFSEGIH